MKAFVLGAAAAAAVIVGASTASATVVDVVYAGKLGYAPDTAGLFGAVGADHVGEDFIVRLRFDTTLGSLVTGPTQTYVRGGSILSTTSPVYSASITINGVTRSFDPSGYAEVLAKDDGSKSSQYNELTTGTYQTAGYSHLQITMTAPSGALPTTLWGPASYTAPIPELIGNFEIDTSPTSGAYANFYPATVTVSEAPEPSTWAMLLAGFAGLGCAGFRRARAARVIA